MLFNRKNERFNDIKAFTENGQPMADGKIVFNTILRKYSLKGRKR